MHSIANCQSAFIGEMNTIIRYSSIICGKFKNVNLKIASEELFETEYAMAFRKGFDQDFKRQINKL